MRRPALLCIAFVLVITMAPNALATTGLPGSPVEASLINAQPSGLFTINHGQWPDSILFRTTSQGVTIWFAEHGLYFQMPVPDPATAEPDLRPWAPPKSTGKNHRDKSYFRLIPAHFANSNPNVQVEGLDRSRHISNYFLGNDPKRWHTNVPSYAGVIYKGIYDGIDYHFYFKDGYLEYDIIAAPGSDVSDVRLSFEQTHATEIDADGTLLVSVGPATIRQHIPHVIQRSLAGDQMLTGLWRPRDPGEYGIMVTEEVNPLLALVVDPVLTFGTYWGGSSFDPLVDLAANANGDIAISGETNSADFPTIHEVQSTLLGDYDVFVAKFSGVDNHAVFSTYIGGSAAGSGGREAGEAVDIDAAGNVYVTGDTQSSDFPTVNAVQPTYMGGRDCFVLGLYGDGDSLIFSTYYGGLSQEFADDIKVDDVGAIYMGGSSLSPDFPLKNSVHDTVVSREAVVLKLDPEGDSVIFSTAFGGSVTEYLTRIAVDDDYNVYILGTSDSPDLPVTPGVLYPTFPDHFVPYVYKLAPTGDSVVVCSYGFPTAGIVDMDVDTSGNIYLTGAGQAGLPVPNGYQQTQAGGFYDWYAAKITPDFSSVIYGTYLGSTSDDEIAHSIDVDSDGRVFLAGRTISYTFPVAFPADSSWTYAAYRGAPANYKMTLALLCPDFSCTIFSTYLAGNVFATDYPILSDLVGPGRFVVGGYYSPTDFPLVDPLRTHAGGFDPVIARVFHAVCPVKRTGDVNESCTITSADIIALVNYVFKSGAEPLPCPAAGDVNCDGVVTSADIIYQVVFVFKGGPWPCNVCELFGVSWNCP